MHGTRDISIRNIVYANQYNTTHDNTRLTQNSAVAAKGLLVYEVLVHINFALTGIFNIYTMTGDRCTS